MAQPFQVRIADSDQYRITFLGVGISRGPGQSGYGENAFLKIKRASPSFSKKSGADGWVTRAKTNNRLIEVHIVLQQTCDSNDYLSSVLANDEENPNGAGVGSFVVEDLQGTTLIRCSKAWIEAPAEADIAMDPTDRDWTLAGVCDVWNVGSN